MHSHANQMITQQMIVYQWLSTRCDPRRVPWEVSEEIAYIQVENERVLSTDWPILNAR